MKWISCDLSVIGLLSYIHEMDAAKDVLFMYRHHSEDCMSVSVVYKNPWIK